MPPVLTILGLGPGNPNQRTIEAAAELSAASRILLRTGIHPGLDDLLQDPRVTTCDDLYEAGGTFDDVYTAIVDRVLALAANRELVYAVPGHPLCGERTVTGVVQGARTLGLATRIVPGISAIDAIASTLGVDVMTGEAQVIDGAELARFIDHDPFNGSLPDCSPTRPAIIGQVYAAHIASAVKIALSRLYPDDHLVTIVRSAGVPGEERVETARLFELDRRPMDHLTSVWIPALNVLDATRSPDTIHRIAARLRAPDGCPWDQEQDHASLRDALIEETYEVVDAIASEDATQLAEELGDLLLQVAMHAQIADETGAFSIGDVFDHINRKLVRRHPHVFADERVEDAAAVMQTWESVKASERGSAPPKPRDPFDRLPRTMPASTKIARLVVDKQQPPGDPGMLGVVLLDAVEAIGRAGLEPERELERAYRARTAGAQGDSDHH